MVAERLLELRKPNFSPLFVRAPSAMASPADAFMRPPMMDYTPPNNNLQDLVNMSAASAIAVQAVMIGGGRIAQGIWNWAAKKWQLVHDEQGNLVDFPTQPTQQLQLMDVEMERPTPPRPPTTIIAQRDDDSNDNIQQAMSSFAKRTRQAAETISIHSKSPQIPTAALFQEPTNDDDNRDQTDEKFKADRARLDRGKWGDNGDKDKAEVMIENMKLKKRLMEYETANIKDEIYEDQRLWTKTPITPISPNASPSKDMKYIADNIERWAQTAIQTGSYPRLQAVNGVMMDVTNMVKLEVERVNM